MLQKGWFDDLMAAFSLWCNQRWQTSADLLSPTREVPVLMMHKVGPVSAPGLVPFARKILTMRTQTGVHKESLFVSVKQMRI